MRVSYEFSLRWTAAGRERFVRALCECGGSVDFKECIFGSAEVSGLIQLEPYRMEQFQTASCKLVYYPPRYFDKTLRRIYDSDVDEIAGRKTLHYERYMAL